ncbi:MAG: hypothetical protein SPI25_04960 [Dialister sp.]|nr:hypothetical protein [Dialister sp.]
MIEMEKIMINDAGMIILGDPKTNRISSKRILNANAYPCDYYWITKDINPAT